MMNKNSIYKCQQCNNSYKHERSLKAHFRNAHSENDKDKRDENIFGCEYQCPQCKISYKHVQNLKKHIRNAHSEIDKDKRDENIFGCEYQCSQCKNSYKHMQSLNKHIKSAHSENNINKNNENIYGCSYCNKKYASSSILRNHIKRCHPDIEINDAKDENVQYVQNVVSNGTTQLMEYICKICKKKCSKEVQIKAHIKYLHNGDEFLHQCNICKRNYQNKKTLQQHTKSVHPQYYYVDSNADIYDTSIRLLTYKSQDESECCITINENNSINIEEDTSTNIDNFNPKKGLKCEYCKKKYGSKIGLQLHMEKKHDVQPPQRAPKIKCCVKDCDIVVSRLFQLRKHLKSSIEDGGHGIPIEREEKNFDSIQDFNHWKTQIEAKNNIRFLVKRLKASENGSYTSNYYCSRSGTYKYRGEEIRSKKYAGTSKMGHYCPSSINAHFNGLGTVTCTYYKTHYGHDTSINDAVHIRIHKRDIKFIVEKDRQGVEPKRILHELHAKGGRSALIKIKDIKTYIKRHSNSEAYLSSQENNEICLPNVETHMKDEVVEHDYNYEMVEPDSLVPKKKDSDNLLSETQIILSRLSNRYASIRELKRLETSKTGIFCISIGTAKSDDTDLKCRSANQNFIIKTKGNLKLN